MGVDGYHLAILCYRCCGYLSDLGWTTGSRACVQKCGERVEEIECRRCSVVVVMLQQGALIFENTKWFGVISRRILTMEFSRSNVALALEMIDDNLCVNLGSLP